jgi:ARID/BRIGHT DNA binding domain
LGAAGLLFKGEIFTGFNFDLPGNGNIPTGTFFFFLQIPIVEKRALDLFTLKKYVLKAGGMEKVNAEKKWANVAVEIGYNPLNSVKIGALLKSHYERILYPLDVFEKEEASKMREEKELKAKASKNFFLQ